MHITLSRVIVVINIFIVKFEVLLLWKLQKEDWFVTLFKQIKYVTWTENKGWIAGYKTIWAFHLVPKHEGKIQRI